MPLTLLQLTGVIHELVGVGEGSSSLLSSGSPDKSFVHSLYRFIVVQGGDPLMFTTMLHFLCCQCQHSCGTVLWWSIIPYHTHTVYSTHPFWIPVCSEVCARGISCVRFLYNMLLDLSGWCILLPNSP